MAIKKAVYEICPKCGALNAQVEGDEVIEGHDCPHVLKPPHAPPSPRGARHLLRNVIFVPGEETDMDYSQHQLRVALTQDPQ